MKSLMIRLVFIVVVLSICMEEVSNIQIVPQEQVFGFVLTKLSICMAERLLIILFAVCVTSEPFICMVEKLPEIALLTRAVA